MIGSKNSFFKPLYILYGLKVLQNQRDRRNEIK